jgi:hypothetical protein
MNKGDIIVQNNSRVNPLDEVQTKKENNKNY